ncbi:MAG: hypothetical protein ACLGIJ_01980 [Candidatus Limnocylindria bacterium]
MGYEPDDMDELDGAGADGFDWTQPLTERTGPRPRAPRPAPRLGLSVPGAIGGALLMGAIALGANLGLAGSQGDAEPTPTFVAFEAPDASDVADETAKAEPTSVADPTKTPTTAPTAKPAETDEEPDATPKPTATPTEKPDATPKPTAKPTEKPDATPKPTAKPTEKPVMSLTLANKEGAVFIDWSGCPADGGDYYKVVRSTDKTVSWPTGGGDEVVAVTEVGGATKAWDEHAPAGTTAWYRVFCVRGTDDGYKVLAATATKSLEAPDEPAPTKTPAPTPYAMWIEAGSEAGVVTVAWEPFGSEGFSHYRILRKVDGSASLRAEIEDAGTTAFVDDDVEVGVTYHYLVEAKGQVSGSWVLLGTTSWTGVTVE